jgi:DNA-binding NarL/FixJ family response regulator
MKAAKEATEPGTSSKSGKRLKASGHRIRVAAPLAGRPQFLIVEDDEGVGKTLKKTLERWVGVTWARNYDEAATAISNDVFSALIVDVRLEGPSAFDVLVKFRELHPRAPAMVLTGYFEQADTVTACALRAQYVVKPISTAALLAFVSGTRGCVPGLSERERDVLERLLLGDTTKGIALGLGISESSVRVLIHRAKKKNGADSRRELLDNSKAITPPRKRL